MLFNRLRLTGFKSFVEATELKIDKGLTGIIGPNGCGKSNLVEALRWVMGESNARRLRGGEMDDVIFNGSANRASRNLAEVVLSIDNTARDAPAAFNIAENLEISRRIERGVGSDFLINGKHTRARDVQTFLADLASGASSAALVSQGRVGAIVNAKPSERRQLLEEAAGVAGLRARRREAELRLQAADANLLRVDDVLGGLETQVNSLRKQARQAIKYRQLSEEIKNAEVAWLVKQHGLLQSEAENLNAAIVAAENALAQAAENVASTQTMQLAAAEAVDAQRREHSVFSAQVQRLVIENETLTRELAAIDQQQAALAGQSQQVAQDIAYEETQMQEAQIKLGLLDEEQAELLVAREAAIETINTAQLQWNDAQAAQTQYEQALGELTRSHAKIEAERHSLNQQQRALEQRQSQLQNQLTQLQNKLAQLQTQLAHTADLPALTAARDAAQAAIEVATVQQQTAELARQQADIAYKETRQAWQAAESIRAKLQAEHDALAALLQRDGAKGVLDQLSVAPGFETALAMALGDAAQAALDSAQAYYWQNLPQVLLPNLPAGATSLAEQVQAPPALTRCMGMIGLVNSDEMGERLQQQLQPGQLLVSAAGAMWRWDGLTIKAGTLTPAAVRLQQRNRLIAISTELSVQNAETAQVQEAYKAAESAAQTAQANEQQMRAAYSQAVRGQADAVRAYDQAQTATQAAQQQVLTAQEQITQGHASLAELDIQKEALLVQLNAMVPTSELLVASGAAQNRQDAARIAARGAQTAYDELQFAARQRSQRLQVIEQEQTQLQQRQGKAGERLDNLKIRAEQLASEQEILIAKPAALKISQAQVQQALLDQQDQLAKMAADVADAEANHRASEQVLRGAANTLGASREARIRLEGQGDLFKHRSHELNAKAQQALGVSMLELSQNHGLNAAALEQPLLELETQLQKAIRQRDGLGPVNLRAEVELNELEAQHTITASEKAELTAAIARLRGAIGHLNREARERLREAFEQVNGHFKILFGELFKGGQAELRLVDSEDPLEAGLEIVAQPPGKKLQSLSLLSGGEQALTAMALIFAMFKTKPSPICVLDEVDAPLDDANVDRFCTLLEAMAKEDKTRFLVITHHRLTMARMDRLYGVTMGEPGISQLVSVDLNRATAMVDKVAA